MKHDVNTADGTRGSWDTDQDGFVGSDEFRTNVGIISAEWEVKTTLNPPDL
jgi:hypothetical protein